MDLGGSLTCKHLGEFGQDSGWDYNFFYWDLRGYCPQRGQEEGTARGRYLSGRAAGQICRVGDGGEQEMERMAEQ